MRLHMRPHGPHFKTLIIIDNNVNFNTLATDSLPLIRKKLDRTTSVHSENLKLNSDHLGSEHIGA
jgi:hypothetical protein